VQETAYAESSEIQQRSEEKGLPGCSDEALATTDFKTCPIASTCDSKAGIVLDPSCSSVPEEPSERAELSSSSDGGWQAVRVRRRRGRPPAGKGDKGKGVGTSKGKNKGKGKYSSAPIDKGKGNGAKGKGKAGQRMSPILAYPQAVDALGPEGLLEALRQLRALRDEFDADVWQYVYESLWEDLQAFEESAAPELAEQRAPNTAVHS
jgi:hypothetical protein